VQSNATGLFPSAYVKLADKPLFNASALYDFAGEHDGTLPLAKGELVVVCAAPDGGWWEGYAPTSGRWGLFPTSYVEKLAAALPSASGNPPPPPGGPGGSSAPELPPDSASVDVPSDDKAGTLGAKRERKSRGNTHKKITQDMILRDDVQGSPSPSGTHGELASGSGGGGGSGAGSSHQRERDPRESELKKREVELYEREAELNERESELAMGESALQKKQVKLKKRESEVAEQKASLDALESELAERKEKLDELDDDVRKRESKLKKKESELRDKKKEVEQKELEVDKKARDVQRRAKELAFQADELAQQQASQAKASVSRDTQREDQLKRAEARLALQNDEVARLQQELSEKEYALQQRDAELTERERDLAEKGAVLAARAQVVKTSTAVASNRRGGSGATAAPLSAVKIDPNLSPEARKQVLRQTVIEEIVQTEADYVEDLELVVTRCLQPARERGIIGAQELQQLFANIEDIWSRNKAVLAQLQQRNDPTDAKCGQLGDVLEGMADTLRSYATYCANHDSSVAVYLKLKESPTSEKHLDELEAALHGHDLCGFLIKPVQRLCKYPLLIRELSRYTDESHRDFAGLQRADKAVQEAVQQVNDYQKRLEAAARLTELSQSFVGLPPGLSIAAAERTFHMETTTTELVDVVSNINEERSVFVFSDVLLIAKPQTRSKLLAYKTHVPLPALRTKDLPANPTVPFGVLLQSAVDRSLAMMLNFTSAAEKKKFMDAIEKAIAAAPAVAPAAVNSVPVASAAAAAAAATQAAMSPMPVVGTVKRGPQKPVLPANPTPEQYKAFMRAKYEYEQWENEQLRKATTTTATTTSAVSTPNTSPKPTRRVPTPAGQPLVPPGTPPSARRPTTAAPPVGAPPPPSSMPAPAAPPSPPPEERAGTLNKARLCKVCNVRKPVAKVTMADGTTNKVCEVCLKDFTEEAEGAPSPPPLGKAPSSDEPIMMSSKQRAGTLGAAGAGTLKKRSSGRLESGTLPGSPLISSSPPPAGLPTVLPLPVQASSAPNLAVAAPAPPAPPPLAPSGTPPLLPGWHEVAAPDGRVYYYHEKTNETTWDRPSAPMPAALPPPPSLAALPSMLPPPIVGAAVPSPVAGRPGTFRASSLPGSPSLAPSRR
jgi:hypothetical protein